MSFLNYLLIPIFANKVGEDQSGNSYYQSRKKNYSGARKRYIIYKGSPEPSKVPPRWHAWLHYLSDSIPEKTNQDFGWQRDHIPNLTGTKEAYSQLSPSGERQGVSADYKAWRPE